MPTSTFTVFLFSHFDASVEHVSKVETCQKSRTKVPYFDALEHSGTWSVLARVCLKWTIALEQMYFQQGRLTFVKLYRSLESSTQDTRDGFDLYSAQASFARPRVDLARLLRRAVSRLFRTIFSEFVKVCGVRFSTRESLIGFCIWCHPISTILACLFSVGVRGQKLCRKGIMAAKMASRASYLVYYYRRTATCNLFVKQSKFHWPFFNIS